jgi:hypothetical protein
MVSSWVHTELKAKLDAQESLYQGSLSQSLNAIQGKAQ